MPARNCNPPLRRNARCIAKRGSRYVVLRLIETFVRLASRGGLADLLDDDGTALNLISIRLSEFGNRQTNQIRLRRNASNQCQGRSDGYASRFPIRKIWKLDRIQLRRGRSECAPGC